jgi:anti-sigma B factor antagonist
VIAGVVLMSMIAVRWPGEYGTCVVVDGDADWDGLSIVRLVTAGSVVLALVGEVDLRTSAALAAALESTIESVVDDGVVAVTLDLAGVRFLDSTGINVVVGGMRKAQAAQIRYEVVGAHGLPERALKLIGVYHLLAAGGDGRLAGE